jgi:predicted dehydrogenase
MAKDLVNVGIVGSMFAAELHYDAYRRLGHLRVVAVSAKTEDEARPFADKHGIEGVYGDVGRMLAEHPEIDLISLCVPNFLHHPIGMQLIAAGKPFVCEKPLATTLEHAREMIAAAAAAGVRMFYAEDWIFSPALCRARAIIGEGAIGRVLYSKGKETHNGSHSIYAQTKEYCGGGAFIHLGCHPVGFVRVLHGCEVVEVMAMCSGGTDGNFFHKKYGGEDWGAALLRFEDGTVSFVEGNYICHGGLDDVVEIYGERGLIKIDLSQSSALRVYSQVGYEYSIEKTDNNLGWTRPAVDEELNLGYPGEIAHFVDCIRTGAPEARGVSADDGLACLEIVLACYESARTGKAARTGRG